jgi:hypothetical protein
MGYGIGFQKSWPGFVPLVGFQGDLFSQESAGLGRSPPSFFILDAGGFQQPIDGGGGDRVQSL